MTAAPPPPSLGPDVILGRSWKLFRHNPVLLLPMLIALLAAVALLALLFAIAVILGVMNGASHGPAILTAAVVGFAFWWLACLALSMATYAALYGMAAALWDRETVTLGDAVAAVRSRGTELFVATIGLVGVGIAAFILALPTLGLAVLALPLFTMYVYPAVVAGGRSGFDAIRESFVLVRHHFGTSAITMLILIAISSAVSFVSYPALIPLYITFLTAPPHSVPNVPPWEFVLGGVGYVLMFLGLCVYFVFAAVVQTGLYRMLRARDAQSSPTTVAPA